MISLNTTFKIGQVKLDIFQSKNVFIFAIYVKLLFDIHSSFELKLNIGLLLDETGSFGPEFDWLWNEISPVPRYPGYNTNYSRTGIYRLPSLF